MRVWRDLKKVFGRLELGFTGFYWVLPSFTGFYLVLLGFTGFYWVLLDKNGLEWVTVDFVIVKSVFRGYF